MLPVVPRQSRGVVSFVLSNAAREFFKLIERQRDGATKFILFDQYYCCLMVGLDLRRMAEPAELDGEVFLNTYPEDFRGQADIIAGLLIDAELDRKGILPEDKSSIEREMIRLLDPRTPTRLSDDGNDLLNLYAAEGFTAIREKMLRPSGLEEFLIGYHDYWHEPDMRGNS